MGGPSTTDRPGGILVVKGEVSDRDAEEIRRRFLGPTGSGIGGAGRVVVIESEDGADFVDTAIAPRDAQYQETRRITKEEILAAFGVPESVFNASGRTFPAESGLCGARGMGRIPAMKGNCERSRARRRAHSAHTRSGTDHSARR